MNLDDVEVSAHVAGMVRPMSDSGACRICRSYGGPKAMCRSCELSMISVESPVSRVVPVALCADGSRYYALLKAYKGRPRRLDLHKTIAAIFWRFLEQHLQCLVDPPFDDLVFVTVPSSWRAPPHPLEESLRLVPWVAPRLVPALVNGTPKGKGDASDEKFATSARSGDCDGQRVVILDDVLTTGASVQSAASILRDNGAKVVGAVVLGRFVRPDYTRAVRLAWDRALARPFDFRICARCDPGDPPAGAWDDVPF